VSEVLELIGGDPISCVDGPCGSIGRLFVEPTSKRITHVAVQPDGLLDTGRFVPIGLVRPVKHGLGLSCTLAEFSAMTPDEHSQLLPVPGMRPGSIAAAWVTILEVPEGELELNGDEPILATDGHVGHLRGIAINLNDATIAKLLLEIGHFSSKRQVEIPAAVLASIDTGGMHLSLSKDDVAKFG
jgi:hypothetical protein